MFEIAGGIILAVLFFVFLPYILAGGLVLLGVAIVIGVGALLYAYMREVLEFFLIAVAFVVSFAVPYVAFQRATKRYPKYRAIIDGDPPFVGLKSLPIRVVVTAFTAVGGVGFAFVSLAFFSALSDRLV